ALRGQAARRRAGDGTAAGWKAGLARPDRRAGPRRICVSEEWRVAGEERSHDCRAGGQRRRLGESVGFAHVRALIFAALVATPAMAHEIGTTQVTAEFRRDHTYVIDVATGAASLLSKIEHRRIAPMPDPVAVTRLQVHARELANAAEIRFGGVPVAPR